MTEHTTTVRRIHRTAPFEPCLAGGRCTRGHRQHAYCSCGWTETWGWRESADRAIAEHLAENGDVDA